VNTEKDQMLKNILKIIVALILIFSGISKIIAPEGAIKLLAVIPVFPHFLIILTVSLLPVVELTIGAFIVTKDLPETNNHYFLFSVSGLSKY